MNIGLLITGGAGNRMGQDIPKQYKHLDGAPIIIHTLQCFQKHPDIQQIAVVCLKGWGTVLQSYANQFNITKLTHVFSGGNHPHYYLNLNEGLDVREVKQRIAKGVYLGC